MEFIEYNKEKVADKLRQLDANDKPLWGSMSAIHMIQHLGDVMILALGEEEYPMETPEQYLEKSKAFLMSDKAMPREYKARFVQSNEENLKYTSINEAVDGFISAWDSFEAHFKSNDGVITMHPTFGPLNYDEWTWLHRKHITHHLQQFELI